MNVVAMCVKPFVPCSIDRAAIRRHHAGKAVAEIALLIKDLATTLPMAFLRGATVGTCLIIGTFAFSPAIIGLGGSFLGTMQGVALTSGCVSVALVMGPRLCDCVSNVAHELRWVINPRSMAERERQDKAMRYARCLVAASTALAGAYCWANRGHLSLKAQEVFAIS
ncbi:MAG: hypothetical protein Q8K75_07995 [Chlamydiales bacterium]|nr:hypothetical protein [Chlamydiales bacterium]